jgi:hypothetical protein
MTENINVAESKQHTTRISHKDHSGTLNHRAPITLTDESLFLGREYIPSLVRQGTTSKDAAKRLRGFDHYARIGNEWAPSATELFGCISGDFLL